MRTIHPDACCRLSAVFQRAASPASPLQDLAASIVQHLPFPIFTSRHAAMHHEA